jgi:hypothetical protein
VISLENARSNFSLGNDSRSEQKNRKTDLTEKTEKKLTEKTEPVQKID